MVVFSCGDISPESKAHGILQTVHVHLRSFCVCSSVRVVTEKGNDFTFLVTGPSTLLYEADSKPEPLSGQELRKPQSPSSYGNHTANDGNQRVVGFLG